MNSFYRNGLCCAEKFLFCVGKVGSRSQKPELLGMIKKGSCTVHDVVWGGYCQQCDFITSATPTQSWRKSPWFTDVLVWMDSLGTTQSPLECGSRADARAMRLGEEGMETMTPGILRNLEYTSHFLQVWIRTGLQRKCSNSFTCITWSL